ncbi:hypothetical protein SME06J_49070 (plasmid) [Serratia marcescens]|nr:hypothetical protein SME06J_49070 [Serratia marcescens]
MFTGNSSTISKVIVAIYILNIGIYSSFAYSIDLVYRHDSRSPGVIYSEGFQALGENDNILSHVEGVSCLSGTRDSAFVPTTMSYEFAVEFGRDVAPGSSFWVYSIRPTNNFYSTYASLMNAYRSTGIHAFQDTADTFREQYEYMAFAGIESEQILGAWLYRSNGLGVPATRLTYTTNPGYVEDQTVVNPDPYPRYYIPTPSSSLMSCERCVNSTSPMNRAKDSSLPGRIQSCKRLLSMLLSG